MQAIEKGADLISGMNINISEATSGHGMIMVNCSGTAVCTKNPSPIIDEYIQLRKSKESIHKEMEKFMDLRTKNPIA